MLTEIHVPPDPALEHHLFPLGVVGADPPYALLGPLNTPPPPPLGLIGPGVSFPPPVSLAAASFCRKLIHSSDIL